jgi:2-iminobutanoate/2-iminopropanoate deaminase
VVTEVAEGIKRMPTHCGSKVCASCVVTGDYVFIAHHTGTYKNNDMDSQTRSAIPNIEKTLPSVSATLKDIVQLNYYISDKNLYSLGAEVFNEYFAENNIARTTIITSIIDG